MIDRRVKRATRAVVWRAVGNVEIAVVPLSIARTKR